MNDGSAESTHEAAELDILSASSSLHPHVRHGIAAVLTTRLSVGRIVIVNEIP